MNKGWRAIAILLASLLGSVLLLAGGAAILLNLQGWGPSPIARTGGAMLCFVATLVLFAGAWRAYRVEQPRLLRAITGTAALLSGILVFTAFCGGLFLGWDAIQRRAALQARTDGQNKLFASYEEALALARDANAPALYIAGAYSADNGILVDGFLTHAPGDFELSTIKPSAGKVTGRIWLEPVLFVEGNTAIVDSPLRRFAAFIAEPSGELKLTSPLGEATVPAADEAPPQVKSLRIYPQQTLLD